MSKFIPLFWRSTVCNQIFCKLIVKLLFCVPNNWYNFISFLPEFLSNYHLYIYSKPFSYLLSSLHLLVTCLYLSICFKIRLCDLAIFFFFFFFVSPKALVLTVCILIQQLVRFRGELKRYQYPLVEMSDFSWAMWVVTNEYLLYLRCIFF